MTLRKHSAAGLVLVLLLSGVGGAFESDLPVRPVISSLVNAASFERGPIAPGEVVTLFGDGLGPTSPAAFSVGQSGRVAQSLAGISVRFNDVPGPVLYASRTQLTVIVPGEIRPGDPVNVRVENGGVESLPFTARAATAKPGLFTSTQSGRGAAAVLNQDHSANSPSNPSSPGSVVQLFVSGGGNTEPLLSDGAVARSANRAAARVTASIGGLPAEVTYAGSAVGLVAGILQVNVRIPANSPGGDNVLLEIAVDGVPSQEGSTLSISGSGLPATPNLEASTSDAGVDLRWNSSFVEGVTSARVDRRSSGDAVWDSLGPIPSLSYFDSEVVPGKTYDYRVRYEVPGGFSRYSPVVSVSAPPAIASPRNAKAIATGAARVYLSWTPGDSDSGLRIERRRGDDAWVEVTSLPPGSSTWRDSGLSAGTAYAYRLRAVGASATSAYSREVSVTTSPAPALPDLAPRVHAADPRRFSIGGATWYPTGYYPSVAAFSADQPDPRYYRRVIDRLSASGINYFRAVFTMGQPYGDSSTPYQRTGPGNAADGRPRFDLTQFNQAYFDYWREIVLYARDKGMVVQLCILDGWHWTGLEIENSGPGKVWGIKYDFYYGGNNINGLAANSQADMINASHPVNAFQKALVRKVVDTVGDLPNIVWEVGNETSRIDWEMKLADVITAEERARGLYEHLVMPRDLPGHQYVPGHCDNTASTVRTAMVRAFPQGLMLISDNDCISAGTPDVRRRKAWATLVSGGHIDLFHFELTDSSVLDSDDAALGMRYVGYVGKFLSDLRIDLAGMTPLPDAGAGWAYGRIGEEYIVYLPAGGRAVLSGVTADLRATWFNPRDGSTNEAGSGTEFDAPDGRDWVLYAVRR